MKLFDQLEIQRFNLIENNTVNWDVMDNFDYSSKELQKTIDQFLLLLKANHQLPGKDYAKLLGISQWIFVNHTATDKQKLYAILSMCYYWDQIDPQI